MPLPTAVKQARGTFRADRAAPNELKVSGRPTCPSWLTPDARKEFRRLAKLLGETPGLLGRVDAYGLARYAETWVRWRQTMQMLQKTGEMQVFKDDAGKVKAIQLSPYSSLARSLAEELSKLEQCFGLHPSSRSRISVQSPDDTEEMELPPS